MVRSLKAVFKPHPFIDRWTVDTEDIDNVLRVEASGEVSEKEVLRLIRAGGFEGEALPD